MTRILSPVLVAALLSAPVAAQDAGKGPSLDMPPDIARAFKRKPEEAPPVGFVFLEAYIALEPDGFPPKGIEVQHRKLGACPLIRLTVPVERVNELQALLQSMAPTPGRRCTVHKF